MADNVVANPGSGGVSFAADDISSVFYPRTKITIGADGINGGDVSSSNPMPVAGTGTAGTANSAVLTIQGIASMTPVMIADNGGSLTVDGTVAATQSGTWNVTNVSGTISLPTGAAIAAKQPALGTAGAASTDVITVQGIASGTGLNVAQSGSWTVAATQSGTWNITNVSGTVSLPTGASTAAKQPALGTAGTASADVLSIQGIASMTPLQIADNGGSLTVDGTVAATQSGTWNITNVSGTVSLPTGAATEASLAKLTIAQAASLGSNTQVLAGASVTSTSPSYGVGTIQPLSVDTNGSLRVNVITQPAAVYTSSSISAVLTTHVVSNNGTALTPKFAAISASSSGDNTVVAAVTSKKIRVLRWSLSANGAVNAKWKSATAGDITGLRYLQQYGGGGGTLCEIGHFETTAGEALVLNLSAAVAVGGDLTYVEV